MLQTHDTNVTESDRLSGLTLTFTHPDDVLKSRVLSASEKREVLAAWASDAHAVPNLPAMRQLDSGAIVSIDTVLEALRALDAPGTSGPAGRSSARASRSTVVPLWRRLPRGRDRDDDDDPPPCPAAALPPGLEIELRRRRDDLRGLVAA